MRLILALCLISAPAFAEDAPAVPPSEDDGFSLMEEHGVLALPAGMQFGGWLGLLMLAAIAWLLYRTAKPSAPT